MLVVALKDNVTKSDILAELRGGNPNTEYCQYLYPICQKKAKKHKRFISENTHEGLRFVSMEEADEEEIREVMADILKDCRVITLATAFDGRPWATTMFFGMKGSDIYCVIEYRGHGMANLKRNPNVAFAIDNGVPDRFVQGTGTAEVVDREEEDEGRKIVLDRVPEYKPFFEMTETSVVRITLREVLVTDVTREWFPAKSLRF